MSHRVRLPGRAAIAAVIAALSFIAATAIASEPAAAQGSISEMVGDIPPDPAPYWDDCGQENQTCQPWPGDLPVLVRYGDYHIPGSGDWALASGNWSVRTVTGSVACTNAVFGDPFVDRAKHCEFDGSGFQYCAPENGTCRVPNDGTAWWVRYGAITSGDPGDRHWNIKKVTDSVSCKNSAFGGDPYYGVAKACWFYAG